MMSCTCFGTDGLSSGRRLYLQLWYSVSYMHQHTLLPTMLLILIRVERTIP